MEQFLDLDFPAISPEAWTSKATADLKGRNPDTLATPVEEGVLLPPCLGPEAIRHIPEYGFIRNTGGWLFCQEIEVLPDLSAHVINARKAGISLPLIRLNSTDKITVSAPVQGPVAFDLDEPIDRYSEVFQPGVIQGQAYLRFRSGELPTAVQSVKALKYNPGLRTILIDVSGFYEIGANYSQQVAIALGGATEIMDTYTDAGLSPAEVAGLLWFRFAAGTDFLAEIAKFRAFRQGYATWLGAYSLSDTDFPAVVFGTTGIAPLSLLDHHTNLLRQTTTALALVCGGCDAIEIQAYDSLSGTTSSGLTLARNISLLMEHEGKTGAVIDPLGGGYAIEYLTDALATKAWSTFLSFEHSGGYTAFVQSDGFHKTLTQNLTDRQQQLNLRRNIRVGVNQYPNLIESISDSMNIPAIHRESVPFEKLRFRMEQHVVRGHHRLKVFLYTFGNLALRKARANFAFDLFGLAGCEIMEAPEGTASLADLHALAEFQPDVVVFCSSDEEYQTELPQQVNRLPAQCITVLAGKPADPAFMEGLGIQHSIYQRMDTLAFLNQVLTQGGVA